MTRDPPETTYAVLGLIDKLPSSSGHELAAAADRSFVHFWPISRTLLYRELNRLVKLAWISGTRVEQTRMPSKWTYQITKEGERALTDWLSQPVLSVGSSRNDALLRFFFAHRMDAVQVRTLLEAYRGSLLDQRDEFTALIDKLATVPSPAARIGRLSALHGLRTAEARLGWVEEAVAALAEGDQH